MSGGRNNTVLRAVLLAGGPRPAPVASETGLSVLDLIVRPDRSVLESWLDEIDGFEPSLAPGFEVRVIYDKQSHRPGDPTFERSFGVRIEEEEGRYRGPAGVVWDACADLADTDGLVLIIEAQRYLCSGGLAELVAEHAADDCGVSVVANPDESPAGVFIVRRSMLERVPEIGFMDLKEQWLQAVLKEGHVAKIRHLREPGCLGIRTRRQYLAAVRAAAAGQGSDWSGVVAPGADVDDSAALVGSVVMPGASVGARAVVARSVVCPGGRVEADAEVVDAAVAPRKL